VNRRSQDVGDDNGPLATELLGDRELETCSEEGAGLEEGDEVGRDRGVACGREKGGQIFAPGVRPRGNNIPLVPKAALKEGRAMVPPKKPVSSGEGKGKKEKLV
jgi:hypothetical protein